MLLVLTRHSTMNKCDDLKKSVIHCDNGDKVESVVYTNPQFAKKIIEYFQSQFQPNDLFLDPCKGQGAFYDHLPFNKDYCEIMEGKDFMKYDKKVNWIITNPPWRGKVYAPFTNHAFQQSDNVVYLVKLFGAIGTNRRLRDMNNNDHSLKEIIITDWKSAGFTYLDGSPKSGEGFILSVVHFQRGYQGGTTWTYW